MRHYTVQQQLKAALEAAAPKTLPDDVVAACVPSEEAEEPPRRPIAIWRPMLAVAAALALLVTGAAFRHGQSPQAPLTAMTVSLDVNPSITLEVDDNDAVVAINTLNEDGSIVVGEQKWTGVAAETAVGALVDSMVQNGYLNDNANSILISVDGTDEARATALEQKLSAVVQAQLTDLKGAVLSQTLTADETLSQKAAQYGISQGKAMLIDRIIETDPLKSFDDLAKLPINDLNLICHTSQMPKVNASGSASDKAYIGNDAAVNAALTHAGLTAEQTVALEVELDCENGVMCYEVEFVIDGTEYEYEIDAATGAVLQVKCELVDHDDDVDRDNDIGDDDIDDDDDEDIDDDDIDDDDDDFDDIDDDDDDFDDDIDDDDDDVSCGATTMSTTVIADQTTGVQTTATQGSSVYVQAPTAVHDDDDFDDDIDDDDDDDDFDDDDDDDD